MSDLLKAFHRRHQEKLEQLERGEVDEAFLDGVQLLIADLRQAGGAVAAPAERGQLRALLRFWGNVLYDRADVYHDTTLYPLDPERIPPPEEQSRRPLPPLIWSLAGGAAAIVIAVGLVAVGRLAQPVEPPPAPAVATLAGYVAIEMEADTFCANVSEVVAEFALVGLEPGIEWRWELERDGEVVAGQSAAPWGREANQATIRILAGGSEGVEAGQYELLVYVGERVVGARSFLVLDAVPRVFNLRAADVPEPAEMSDEGVFADGARVLYLSYEYEGWCPGLNVSHTLYRAGEQVQERVEVWSGAPQGEAQVSFQSPGGLPFPSGEYEAAVTVEGAEQSRVGFTLGEARAEITPSPALGDVTIALGAQPDGAPIVTAPDNLFDWNTKVVYGIFDYVGMRDGLRWAAVWMRNGQEEAREEHFWDVEADGTEGTRWVAHYAELGRVLSGGSYSVTLYIDNVAQSTADFRILYYAPPE